MGILCMDHEVVHLFCLCPASFLWMPLLVLPSEHAGRRVHSISPAFQARGDLFPAGKPVQLLSCPEAALERAVRPRSLGLSMEALQDPQSLAQGPVWHEGVKMMQ